MSRLLMKLNPFMNKDDGSNTNNNGEGEPAWLKSLTERLDRIESKQEKKEESNANNNNQQTQIIPQPNNPNNPQQQQQQTNNNQQQESNAERQGEGSNQTKKKSWMDWLL